VAAQHDGTVVAWHYNGAGVRLSHAVLVASMSGFRVHAVGDMNGDGNADLLWQGVSGSNATTIIWYMNGAGARSSFRTLATLPNAWTLGTVGDYNGDGHMDVVWKNNSTGQIVGWALNATQQRVATTPSPPAWPPGGLGEKSEGGGLRSKVQGLRLEIGDPPSPRLPPSQKLTADMTARQVGDRDGTV
jgi:hypothetical protein